MFDEDERFVTSDFISEDAEIEVGLRPRNLSEYIGQEKAKNNLEIYIKAALERREASKSISSSSVFILSLSSNITL